jgi:hypothetical protein
MRDEIVAGALRSLDVPEHGPGFWDELAARIDETWAPAGRVRRRTPARWLAAAAAVTILAGGALVATQAGDGAGRRPVAPVTTPDATTAPVARVPSVQGVLVESLPGEPTERWTFALDAAGRFAIRTDDGTSTVSDAAAGVAVNTTESGEVFARRGTPLGDPDGVAFLRRDLGWAIAALAADGDGRVATGEHDGRPVWRFDADVQPNPLADGSVDHVDAIVDRATALPLLVRESADGAVVHEQRVEDLRVGARIDPAVFETDAPATDDLGWRRVAADGAPAIDVPAGYELARVAVHDEPHATGPEGGNPTTGPVTAYEFRRGIDVLVVTVQPAGPPDAVWDDPLASEGVPATRPLSGVARGGIAVDPRVVPHAWAIRGARVVTVYGAAGGAELIRALLSVAGP